jgi:hypothetical protein
LAEDYRGAKESLDYQSKATGLARSLGVKEERILKPRTVPERESEGQLMRTLDGNAEKQVGTIMKTNKQKGSDGWVTASRATEAGSVTVETDTSVARSLWESKYKENKMKRAVENIASRNEKGQDEKTIYVGGIALGIRAALNVKENDYYTGELIAGTV